MAAQDRIAMIETKFQKDLESTKLVEQDIVANLETVTLLKEEHVAEVKAAEEKGFEAGLSQAGQAGGSDKIYSDAELNAELQPLREEIAGLKSSNEALKQENEMLKVDLEAAKNAPSTSVEDAVAKAVAETKRTIGQQIKDTNVDNDKLASDLLQA